MVSPPLGGSREDWKTLVVQLRTLVSNWWLVHSFLGPKQLSGKHQIVSSASFETLDFGSGTKDSNAKKESYCYRGSLKMVYQVYW